MRTIFSFMTEYGSADEFFKAVMKLDKKRVEQLCASGVTLTDNVKYVLTKGGGALNGYNPVSKLWSMYLKDLANVEKEDFVWISRVFFGETHAPLYYSASLEKAIRYVYDTDVFTVLLECYNLKRMNRTNTLKWFIRWNLLDLLEKCAAHGWLNRAKRRDEMIEYAQSLKNSTEAVAWLLDFKNRTADYAADRANAEKKAQRELNAASDSAHELKKLWNWKKQENGTIIITGYKGEQSNITVPAKICGVPVTAIGEYAMNPDAPRLKHPTRSRRSNIQNIFVANGIKSIGKFAFGGRDIGVRHYSYSRLTFVTLPESLQIFESKQAALDAPPIIAERENTTVIIPRSEAAKVYCIKHNLKFCHPGSDKVHNPLDAVIASDPLFKAILEADGEKIRELKANGAVLKDYIKECLLSEQPLYAVLKTVRNSQIIPLFSDSAPRVDRVFATSVSEYYTRAANMFKHRNYILKTLVEELGEPIYFPIRIAREISPEMLDRQLMYTKTNHLDRIAEMKRFLADNKLAHLAVCAKNGWLKLPATREKVIEFATSINNTEAVAWLLDFKNRTADIEGERKRAEKKKQRELNAAPDSPLALKEIWSWKKQEDGTLVITSYKGTESEVSVPSMIGKNAVTAIGKRAFSEYAPRLTEEQKKTRRMIQRIVLPEGIRVIGEEAFYECSELCDINIPASVEEIGDAAFYSAKFTEFVIPETVKKIGERLFSECSSLRYVKLPENVTEIGDYIFKGCKALEGIKIPDDVKRIGRYAFDNCKALTEITIPEGVTEIGISAFGNCEKLTEIVIPNSVTELGNGVFQWCSKLRSVSLSENISRIGSYAFLYCKALTEITLPDGITEIDTSAFNGCYELSEIILPKALERIGNNAFSFCNKIEKLELPKTLRAIEYYAFNQCTALRSAEIPEGVETISAGLFFDCKALQSVTLPSSLISIGAQAFQLCQSLTRIDIPDGVVEIGARPFGMCPNLKEVYIPASVKKMFRDLDGTVFHLSKNVTAVVEPDSYAEEYCKEYGIAFKYKT